MPEDAGPPADPGQDGRRTAVADLGSNSFRLVVFTDVPGSWWKRTDELYDAVRIGAGMRGSGALQPDAIDRALHTLEHYAHFCRATHLGAGDVHAVATSAVRDAANRAEFLAAAEGITGLSITVLSREEEARFGYLAAVNSTTLADGAVLDLGGGSMQLVGVRGRQAEHLASWPLGAVRMTERFLADGEPRKKQLKALRSHVRAELASAPWLDACGDRLVGIGGTVRNLAAAAQYAAGLPSLGVQGFVLERDALDGLIERFLSLTPAERGAVPGIKPERGDLILAGAIVIQAALEAGGFDALEATEAGLREGVFFAQHLAPADPPLFASVLDASVRNLAAQYRTDDAHVLHVAALSLQMFDALAAAGLHAGDPEERELVWAAALLHDIGMTVDYDDHHKHSRYLILNGGLPGFAPREVALIALMARYHRKGSPSAGDLAPLLRPGDEACLRRGAALLRLAEQLERSRDQLVRSVAVEAANGDGPVRLVLDTVGDLSVARWAAARQTDLFEAAFGRPLTVV